MPDAPILIAGAGPTGLVLALGLARRGTPFRLISEAAGPGEHSRAMGVQARTLEFYRQFGFAEEMVAQGVQAAALHLRKRGKDGRGVEVATARFRDLGDGISPYPFMLTYPQDEHERFLIGKLEAMGVQVEWNARLAGFSQDDAAVRASIEHGDGRSEEATFSYLCGCDGAHSQVRRTLAIPFAGGTYEQMFYVADVRIQGGFDPDLYVNLGAHLLALMMPVRSNGMQRLIGLLPPELSSRKEIGFDDIRARVEPLVGVQVAQVNWFSAYRVHHRVAERFRAGRCFLLGDAGHIHSPVGGQGMNTGIGDAINLGWKLADVAAGLADPKLLDTYEPERIGFARKLVATTDRVFVPMVAAGFLGELTRRVLAPLAAGLMTRFAMTRKAMFRTLSQTHIHYHESPLSEGKAGRVRGGDRLPWTGGTGEDNFAALRSRGWQVHVYGDPAAALRSACAARALPLHGFHWSHAAETAGLARDAAYLVRPDGYVALALPSQAAADLDKFLDRWRLTFPPPLGA